MSDLPDLDLAARCGRGDAEALAEFEARFGPVIESAARRFGDATFATEVSQAVRARLFTSAHGTPRITEFCGRGALRGFVQAVATRTALNQLTAQQRRAEVQSDDALLDLSSDGDDPELAAIKARYRQEFKAAFSRALHGLQEELRTSVRLHYLDGLTLAEIAALYGWSVPTASRRISAARAQLLESTRALLSAELKLNTVELDSLLRLISSRLSVDGLHEQ